MSKWVIVLLMAAVVAMSATVATAQTLEERVAALEKKVAADKGLGGLSLKWQNGLVIVGENFRGRIGGRLQLELYGAPKTDQKLRDNVVSDDFKTAVDVRRAWLTTQGVIGPNARTPIKYILEISFENQAVVFQDAYVQFQKIPVIGAITVGHFQEPYSMEELTSNKYNTFMERSVANVFAPGYNVGLQLGNSLGTTVPATWAVGAFRETDGAGFNRGGNWDFIGRVTAAPIYRDNGRQVLHLGAAGGYSGPRDIVDLRVRPESNLAPFIVGAQTNNADIEESWLYNLEAAGVIGQVYLQGEFNGMLASSHDANGQDFNPFGYYVQVGFFSTGEVRPYNPKTGTWGRIKPLRNFGDGNGIGALEVAVRWSHVDMNYHDTRLGNLTDITVALNWYLNPNIKVMGNYVVASRSAWGNAQILMLRVAADF